MSAPGAETEDAAAANDAAASAHQAHCLANVNMEYSAHEMVSVLSQHFVITETHKMKSVSGSLDRLDVRYTSLRIQSCAEPDNKSGP